MDAIRAQELSQMKVKAPTSETNQTQVQDNKEKNIKDGNKKALNILMWTGAIALGGILAIKAIKSGKKPNANTIPQLEKVKDEAGKTINKVGDKILTFKNGIPMLDGKIVDEYFQFQTKGGAIVTYQNGKLLNAAKPGDNGFVKMYSNGLLSRAKIKTADGTKEIIHKHNENGKLTQIIENGKETFNFNYDNNGKLNSYTKNGEFLDLSKEKAQEVTDNTVKIDIEEPKVEENVVEAPKETTKELNPQETPKIEPEKEQVKPTEPEKAEVKPNTGYNVQGLENAGNPDTAEKIMNAETLEKKLEEASKRSGNLKERLNQLDNAKKRTLADRRKIAQLRKLDPEYISALNDKQIQGILTSQTEIDYELLTSTFSADELRRISINPYTNSIFLMWVQKGLLNEAEKQDALNTLLKAAGRNV